LISNELNNEKALFKTGRRTSIEHPGIDFQVIDRIFVFVLTFIKEFRLQIRQICKYETSTKDWFEIDHFLPINKYRRECWDYLLFLRFQFIHFYFNDNQDNKGLPPNVWNDDL